MTAKLTDAEKRKRAKARRIVQADSKTRAEIANSNLLTPEEERALIVAAWERATDPESAIEALRIRGRAPLKAKGRGTARPIIVIDRDGKPTKIVPSSQLLQALLEREGVEGATVEAKRPTKIRCVDCGAVVVVGGRRGGGHNVLRCRDCALCAQRASNNKHAKSSYARRFAIAPDEVRRAAAERGSRYRDKNRDLMSQRKRERRAADPSRARDEERRRRKANREIINNRARERRAAAKAGRDDVK